MFLTVHIYIYICVCVCVLNMCWLIPAFFLFQQKLPPHIPSSIPFLGHAVSFGQSPLEFLHVAYQKVGNFEFWFDTDTGSLIDWGRGWKENVQMKQLADS